MVDFRAQLPAEEAATLIAAITAAKDQFGTPPEKPAAQPPETATSNAEGGYSSADAVLDVARVFLDTAPAQRSGEDRNLVVVHVSAENLASSGAENVPAGTFRRLEAAGETDQVTYDVPATKGSEEAENVPAGTLVGGQILPSDPASEAHHRVSWADVGSTDLDNLTLLCQWHQPRSTKAA